MKQGLYRRIVPIVLIMGFFLGTYNGNAALWQEGAAEPRRIFPIPVSALPEKERQMLEEGIPIRDPETMNRLLEEYLSGAAGR